jgi:hypothetical protein
MVSRSRHEDQNLFTGLFLGVLAVAAAAPPIQAFLLLGTPTAINPGTLNASGVSPITAIFAFSDSAHTSELVLQGFGDNPIFNNSMNNSGDIANLGTLSGPQVLGLNDLTTGTSFLANVPDANGNFHAHYTATCNSVASCGPVFGDFSVAALPGTVNAVIAGLSAGTEIVFVGWKDLTAGQGSDWDHNDLIIAFTNNPKATLLAQTLVPEPASAALLGAALLGFGITWHRRRSA